MPYHFRDEDAPEPLRHKTTITEYLSHPMKAPEPMTAKSYLRTTPAKREVYDRARIIYCSGGIALDTPQVQTARRLLTRASSWNVGDNSGAVGLMLDGDSTTGKTETLKMMGRSVMSQYRRLRPDFKVHQRIPIVYTSVPAASTAKGLVSEFADFLGIPVLAGESMTVVKSRVIKALNQAGTQLVMVDELQNLASRTTGLGDSVDVLKELHEKVSATFLYAGIDLRESLLFKEEGGQQLLGRFTVLNTTRLDISDPTDRAVWRGFINRFETKLPLHDQEPGSLLNLSNYLYQRTSGSIGSLARLLTGAAMDLIDLEGAEKETITEELMDGVVLDHRAETLYANFRGRSNPRDWTPATLTEVAYPKAELVSA